MYLNILFLTLLFIDTGCPSSNSTPASPPSPARPAIFRRSSSSSCAIVFLPVVALLLLSLLLVVASWLGRALDLICEDEGCDGSSFFSLVEVELERRRRIACGLVSCRKEAVRIGSMVIDVRSCLVSDGEGIQICVTYCRVTRAHPLRCVLLVDQRWHHSQASGSDRRHELGLNPS
jgi:hypothetical protein